MKTLHLLIALLITYSSIAQNCNCDNQMQNKQAIEAALDYRDTIAITGFVNTLKSINTPTCNFWALFYKTRISSKTNQLKIVENLITQAEEFAAKANCNNKFEAEILLLKADYYQEIDSIELATNFAFKFLKLAEASKNNEHEFIAITILGSLFTRQDDEKQLKPLIQKAITIANNTTDNDKVAKYYNWIARIYENDYANTEEKNKLDTTELFTKKAMLFAKKVNNLIQIQHAFQLMEAIEYHKGNFSKSLANLDSSYYYMKAAKSNEQIPVYFVTKASSLIEMGNAAGSITCQDSAIYYARTYSQPSFLSNILKAGAGLYEAAGNKDKALATFKEYTKLKDSLFNTQRTTIINELQTKYGKEKDQIQIKQLSQQRTIYFLLTIAGLLGLAALGFYLRQQSLKHKQNIMEAEQRLNRARMNPHFFFNALSSLQTIALKQNDGKSMASNLSKFSHIMRETLESTYKEYVTIEQEIDFLNEYIELQKLRFPKSFNYSITTNKNLEIDDLLIPSMILQPFIENSIEHGFANIDYNGELKIEFLEIEKELTVTITDNGQGLALGPKIETEHISRASQIIKDRIYLLNLKLKTKAGFLINNNPNAKGVIVKINLPLLYKSSLKS